MISQTLKDNSEVFGMIFLAFRIDEDIINKDHNEFIESVMNTEFMRHMK
jgi:hypothetical protein